MNDAPSNLHSGGDLKRIARVSGAAAGVFALLYLLFFSIHSRFPYIQAGAVLVANLKHEMARRGDPFSHNGSLRVLAFGNSKTLAGFIPELFDSEMAAAGLRTESYNFGLPGDPAFIPDLEMMASRGVAPDVALLILPWPAVDDQAPTFFHFVKHDGTIINHLFPFRKLPRDLFIMATEAKGSVGNFRKIYSDTQLTENLVRENRGHYFIARQSHFPGDQLPVEFRLPTDDPDRVSPRVIPRGPLFDRMASLCQQKHIQCIFVPNYFRQGQFAPAAAINEEAARSLAGEPEFAIAGPDYVLLPNPMFSDPVHLNPKGAAEYTRLIAKLVEQSLQNRAATEAGIRP